jgi:hypothetical protein
MNITLAPGIKLVTLAVNQEILNFELNPVEVELSFPSTVVIDNSNSSSSVLPIRIIISNSTLEVGFNYLIQTPSLLQLNLPSNPSTGDTLEVFTDSTGLYKLYGNHPISMNRETALSYIESKNEGDYIRLTFLDDKWLAVYFSGWFEVN